jgi:hypothetical protein
MVLKTQIKRATLIRFLGHIPRTFSKGVGLGVFVLLLLVPSSSMSETQYPVDRTPGQGKMWLGWSSPERERFILGYLWAYHSGFSSGCVTYFDSNSARISADVETSPLQKCKLQELAYSKDASYYEREVTKYYETYPKDSDLPLSWLLLAFSDTENKSATETHAAWARGHSHP